MKKVVSIGILYCIIFMSVNFGSPTSASAAGTCLTDKTGLTEFNDLGNVDVVARLIYSEAMGESLNGKRAV